MMSSREETQAIDDEGRKIDVGKRDQRVDRLVQYYDDLQHRQRCYVCEVWSLGYAPEREGVLRAKEFKGNSADVP